MWNDYEENIRLPPESGRLCAMIMILFRRRLLPPQLPSGADYYDCNRCRHEGVYLCVLYIRERVHSQLRGLNPLARIVFATETKRYPIMYTRDKRLRIFRSHPPPPRTSSSIRRRLYWAVYPNSHEKTLSPTTTLGGSFSYRSSFLHGERTVDTLSRISVI